MDWIDCPAVNGVGPEIHVTFDTAQAPVNVESNIDCCVNGKQQSEVRGGWPIRTTHNVYKATSEAQSVLAAHAKSNGDTASKLDQSEEESDN